MLIISRKKNEWLDIGDDVEIVVISIHHDRVRLGINAPKSRSVYRREVTIARANAATESTEDRQ